MLSVGAIMTKLSPDVDRKRELANLSKEEAVFKTQAKVIDEDFKKTNKKIFKETAKTGDALQEYMENQTAGNAKRLNKAEGKLKDSIRHARNLSESGLELSEKDVELAERRFKLDPTEENYKNILTKREELLLSEENTKANEEAFTQLSDTMSQFEEMRKRATDAVNVARKSKADVEIDTSFGKIGPDSPIYKKLQEAGEI